MIRGLWDRQADAIIDFKVCDADADSYRYDPRLSLLSHWETIREDKYVNHCHNQNIFFHMFVLSFKGMLGRESLLVLAQLSQTMAVEMK